jgi:hypothetical protein
VVPTSLNTNHDLAVPIGGVQVAWTDGRSASRTRAEHAERMRKLHEQAPYRTRALAGLSKARKARTWRRESILDALRAFRTQTGRWPVQGDLRVSNGLPSYGPLRRELGSLPNAIEIAAASHNLAADQSHSQTFSWASLR